MATRLAHCGRGASRASVAPSPSPPHRSLPLREARRGRPVKPYARGRAVILSALVSEGRLAFEALPKVCSRSVELASPLPSAGTNPRTGVCGTGAAARNGPRGRRSWSRLPGACSDVPQPGRQDTYDRPRDSRRRQLRQRAYSRRPDGGASRDCDKGCG
eukprot:scaffold2404_cov398-Prasinococcus_capsulatus_cf.AAC.48